MIAIVTEILTDLYEAIRRAMAAAEALEKLKSELIAHPGIDGSASDAEELATHPPKDVTP